MARIPENIETTKWNGQRTGYTSAGLCVRICGSSGSYSIRYGHSIATTQLGLAGKFIGTAATLAEVSRIIASK